MSVNSGDCDGIRTRDLSPEVSALPLSYTALAVSDNRTSSTRVAESGEIESHALADTIRLAAGPGTLAGSLSLCTLPGTRTRTHAV